MEITSLHWSSSLLHREQARNTRTETPQFAVPTDTQPVFGATAHAPADLDFSAISPRLLREVALQKYVAGNIPQDVYIALAQELPMEAVDSTGTVLDLSGVTDDTEFDFQTYFREQRDLSSALGDGENAATFGSVLEFMRS